MQNIIRKLRSLLPYLSILNLLNFCMQDSCLKREQSIGVLSAQILAQNQKYFSHRPSENKYDHIFKND